MHIYVIRVDPLGMNTCKWMLNILDGTAASCNIWPLLAYFWHLRSDAGVRVSYLRCGIYWRYRQQCRQVKQQCRSKSCHIWRVLASSWHVSEVTLERGERGDHTRVSAHLARLSPSIKTYGVYGYFYSRQYFSLNKIPRNYILHGSSNLFTIKICWDKKQKSQTNNLREHWRKDWIQGHQFVFSKNRRGIVESKEQGLRFELTGLTSKHHPMCDHIRLFSTHPPHTPIAQWWCDVQRRCLRLWGSNFSRRDQLPSAATVTGSLTSFSSLDFQGIHRDDVFIAIYTKAIFQQCHQAGSHFTRG